MDDKTYYKTADNYPSSSSDLYRRPGTEHTVGWRRLDTSYSRDRDSRSGSRERICRRSRGHPLLLVYRRASSMFGRWRLIELRERRRDTTVAKDSWPLV